MARAPKREAMADAASPSDRIPPILLGVTGGVAAYKACELVRQLQQGGHRVRVILTRGGARFVSPLAFAALTGEPTLTRLFASAQSGEAFASSIDHIALAQSAKALVVAPATAHCLAKLAHGLADDLLSTVYLATSAPIILAPSMNVNMWRHPATQANLQTLARRPGLAIVAPEAGYLACGMVGEGRLADPADIAAAVEAALRPAPAAVWAGHTVLITAGPTREPLDPVRYFSNRSSGRMGFALARAAAQQGARVQLVFGPTTAEPPADPAIELIPVTTAAEMAAQVLARFAACDAAILAAAVADYRPARPAAAKIKKSPDALHIELLPTTDILAELGRRKTHQLLVGFAAETGDPRPAARAKLTAKNADLIVGNDVAQPGVGFDSADNAVVLVSAADEAALPRASKDRIAGQILAAIAALPRPVPVPAKSGGLRA